MRELTALVADDSEPTRALIRATLRHLGCQVVKEVGNGSTVMEAIAGCDVDIIFLDINMPGASGLELLAQIVTEKKHDYVVIISGDDTLENEEAARIAGAKHFMGKPFKAATLQKILEERAKLPETIKTLTALIADDDDMMRLVLNKMLAQYHCVVSAEVSDGVQALSNLITLQPDILFLDIEMPVMGGIETLQQVKKLYPKLFTVIASGHGNVENVKSAISAGANGFIVKPFATDKVKQIVDKYRDTLKAK